MEVYFRYESLEERQGILERNTDKQFLRFEDIRDKRFLVFDDGTEPPFDFPTELLKAFALVTLDENKALRSEISALKARIAALDSGDATALPQRTVEQLKSAVKAKMGS